MGSISPNSTATAPSSNGAVTSQEEARNMLAAALGIDTINGNGNSSTGNGGNTSHNADSNVNGNTNEGQKENGNETGNGNGNASANAAPHTKYVSLYVGDLSTMVKDENLFEFFQKENLKIVTVKVCRDMQTGDSLGYGYANFLTHDDGIDIYIYIYI
jgi:RNA recognition motif-containing protein